MIPKIIQIKFDKIEKDRFILKQELSNYSNEQLNTKPRDGGWSPMQIIRHLIEAEEGTLKYIQKKLSFNPKLETTGFKQQIRFLIFQMVFRSPFKVKAPRGISEALPEYSDFEETMKIWEDNRQEFKLFLEHLDDNLWDKAIFKHPIMGRIAMPHTLGFFDEHIRRHKKQIQRAL